MHKYHSWVTRTLEVTELYVCSFMAFINSVLLEHVPSGIQGSVVRWHTWKPFPHDMGFANLL